MNHKLAKGRVIQGNKLNFLLIKDEETNVTRDVTHNINYEIDKILRENYFGKNIVLELNVKVLKGWER